MDARTRGYLAGRFRDHYRRSRLELPPDAHRREWGYIPWDGRTGTTMIRHRSLADIGDLDTFLRRTRPRHVYHSAARYADPAVPAMGAKGWEGADLIFDLDADHLPGVTPDDPHAEMLARCKEELYALLDILRDDFAFDSLEIVFSGNRGYHVHVRDDDVRALPRRARRDIVEYVRGQDVELGSLIDTEIVAGVGRKTPAPVRRLNTEGGWSARVHRELVAFIDDLRARPSEEARRELEEIEGIGDRRATAILEAIDRSYAEIARGNIDVHPAIVRLVEATIERASVTQGAAIDEPVTTDVNRLIRLPGSLHGGSGLVARPVRADSLGVFDPLEHAIPASFREEEIAIELDEPVTLTMAGERYRLEEGGVTVPEYVGVHLMASERARKAPEAGG